MTDPEHLSWVDSLSSEHRKFVEQILGSENYPKLLAGYAAALKNRASRDRNLKIARDIAIKAWALEPDNPSVKNLAGWAVYGQNPLWHFPMVQDQLRNRIYRRAIEKYVKPDSLVFEIGAGSGILALMAARAGARHVYSCESSPLLASIARRNVEKNGFGERITIIPKSSFKVCLAEDLPDRPDVLISEIVDNDLLGEAVLPIMEDAWGRLLKPETVVLPGKLGLAGALIGGDRWCGNVRVNTVQGFDLSALNDLSPVSLNLRRDGQDVEKEALSSSQLLFEFDLTQPGAKLKASRQLAFEVTRSGTVDGMLVWIFLQFDDELQIENRPPVESAWVPRIHLFERSFAAGRGSVVNVEVSHDRKSVRVELQE